MSSEQDRHDDLVEARAEAERGMRPPRVPVDVYETRDALVVVAPLPSAH